ncbi:ABC transporter, membrane protein, ABC-2 family [Citrifermentans bemidjiense Bem]|uniref:Transport permease protein n=1 Tax=Citrifermentans bemidjiense (strain ATCC BAA-1014 / DSM 16622 / JCM 12645 / Bem) TaxID=404380 RepID=B5E7Q9_CITBB|nr:ABC transporter permease [Citrifermentans bemidjiense]ACH37045.1 ABC transporter, membrane protein, ABC-2 family [Citrifermentans bemidjiense Bem]
MFKGAFSIWSRDMMVLRRSIFSELVAVIAYPLTLYLAFGFGLKGYITDVSGVPYPLFIAPGLISMTAINAAFDESSWSMWFHRRVQRTIEEYRVTPITVYDIVIGKILSGFSQGAVKGTVVFLVILLLTPFRIDYGHLPVYLMCIAISSMTFSCLGTICGTVIDKPENIGRVQSVVIVPLIFMAGIFFPLSSYPASIRPFIELLPTTAVFEGARDALLQGSVPAPYLINLVATAAVSFLVAVYTFDRKMAE